MNLHLALGSLYAAEATPARRRLAGLVLPYGTYGNTSAGRFRVTPGAVTLPAELSRLRLFYGHDRERPIGYATEASDDAAGLHLAFRIAATAAGDDALLEASEGIRDAFSVELDDVTAEGDAITGARLVGVALLPVPAYADARITEIAATAHPTEGIAMTEPAPAPDPTPTDPTPDPVQPDAPVPFTAEATLSGELTPLRAAARPVALAAAARPVALQAARSRSVHEAAEAVSAWLANPNDPALSAALADITYTGMAAATTPGWLGELWSGVRYQRQIVPLISSADLTSNKYTGWQWTTPPKGDSYAGDKAAIPTNTPVVAPVNLTAERWAGGHDIDRAWVDFNDTEFLDSYSREMADSYASYTDDDCLEKIIAGGTDMTAADLVSGLIDGILQVGLAHLVPTFYLLSPDLIKTYAGMTTQNVPPILIQLLGNMTVESLLSSTYHTMPANTLIVGARSAAEFRELPGSPLRFDALELARGGVDRAFFGYHQTFMRKPAAIAVVTIGTGP